MDVVKTQGSEGLRQSQAEEFKKLHSLAKLDPKLKEPRRFSSDEDTHDQDERKTDEDTYSNRDKD